MTIWRTVSYPLTSQTMRPSGSSARKTGRPPLIVAISGTGWPGSVGVNLTGLLSTVIRYSSQARPGQAGPDHGPGQATGTATATVRPTHRPRQHRARVHRLAAPAGDRPAARYGPPGFVATPSNM